MFLFISVLDVLAGRCVASRSARGVSAGVEIVSFFFHVSLFRNYRTLSIALRCFISFSFRILMSFHVFSRTFLSLMFRLAPPRMFRHFLEFSSVFVLLVYRFVLFLYFLLLPRALARGASPRAAAWGVAGQQALWGRVVGVTPPL